MEDGNWMSSAEDEASFDLEEWVKELLFDDEDGTIEFRIGQVGTSMPPPSVNNISQESSINQIAMSPNVLPSICQNSMPTVYAPCNLVPQVQQGHQFPHQALLMQPPADRVNMQPLVLPSSSHLSNQRQQQQQPIQMMQPPQKMHLQPESQRIVFSHSQNVLANQVRPTHVGSPQVGSENSNDWFDLAFQHLQFLKGKYMSELIKLFESSRELRHKATTAKLVIKHERNRSYAEKTITFLHLSKADLLKDYSKEGLYSKVNEERANLARKFPKKHIKLQGQPQQHVETSGGVLKTSQKQAQQRPNILQRKMSQCLNSTPIGTPPCLKQQGKGKAKLQADPSNELRKGDASPIINSNAYSLTGSGLLKGVEQRAHNMFPHSLNGATRSNDAHTLHPRVALSKNILNTLDSSVSSIARKSVSTSHRKPNQAIKIPNAKQPLQQPLTGKNKQQMVPKFSNTLKYGLAPGLNQNLSSSSSYHVGFSPQTSQHTSRVLSSTFSNHVTPLLSASSQPVFPSPLIPITPSSALIYSQKSHPRFHSASLEERTRFHQMPAGSLSRLRNTNQNQSIVTLETGIEARMKRQLSTMVSNDSTSAMNLNADSRMKRLKLQHCNPVLQEVEEINQMLSESVVDVISTEDVIRAQGEKGILIRCCYTPAGLAGQVRILGPSENMFRSLLLELIVTPDYPNSSPIVSETPPLDFRGNEGKNLWMKAKSIFSSSLRQCVQPISLKEMIKTWDASARRVMQEFAQQKGGGSFH